MFFGFALAAVAIIMIDAAVTKRSFIGVINNAPHGSDVTDALGMTGGTTSPTANNPSTAGSPAAAAQQALASKSNYEYSKMRPYPSSLFGKAPIKVDCSSFVTLCYKAAGWKDPNGLAYSGAGFTGTLIVHGKQTMTPQANDLAFYDNPAHVTICMGDGSCISMGQPGDPQQLPVTYREVAQYRTYKQ